VKAAGWLLGLVAFGGLIVLSVAGMTAAIGVLVTATAIVGMIALGNLLGGRTTPDHPPHGRGRQLGVPEFGRRGEGDVSGQ